MKRITTNFALWLLVGGNASFLALYYLMGHNATVEIASGLLLGGYIVLGMSWSIAAVGAVLNRGRLGSDILGLGIFWAFTALAIRQLWVTDYRRLSRPEWMLEHWTNPYLVYSIFWGLLIMILAPGTNSGEIPTANKIFLLVAVIIGAMAAGIAIGFSYARGAF